MDDIKLIVGLGNPGSQYVDTRHNVGFWLVEELASQFNSSFKDESKFKAKMSSVVIKGKVVRLMLPQTFMNLSGVAVSSFANFFNIEPEQILVVHDEVGLKECECKIKKSGGHNGHNGLKDIDARIGKDYWRLRFGVGHPGNKDQMVGYVLGKPRSEIFSKYKDTAYNLAKLLARGEFNKMNQELCNLNKEILAEIADLDLKV